MGHLMAWIDARDTETGKDKVAKPKLLFKQHKGFHTGHLMHSCIRETANGVKGNCGVRG